VLEAKLKVLSGSRPPAAECSADHHHDQ